MIWHSPGTLMEALAIRAEHGARVIAGGTDIFPERAQRRGWGDMREETVLDLSRIAGLRHVARDRNAWRIGALVTWTDLIRETLPPEFDALCAAAREIGGKQIQNAGTVVGNLCTASPAGDGIPCLMALEAHVELASSGGARRLPIDEFVLGRRRTACRDDEIVTAILVPARERTVSAFRKLGARRYLVISIAMASAVIETTQTGRIARARVAVGACGETAQRLLTLESSITGLMLDDALPDAVADVHVQHLAPIDDVRSSRLYRRAAAKQLVRELFALLARPPQRDAA